MTLNSRDLARLDGTAFGNDANAWMPAEHTRTSYVVRLDDFTLLESLAGTGLKRSNDLSVERQRDN